MNNTAISCLQVCLLFFGLLILSSCSLKKIIKVKNITYWQADSSSRFSSQRLDIYAPKKTGDLKNVYVFIHGGSWNSGKKSTYRFLGSRMARKEVVTVIIEYPLSPMAQYSQMASASAKAVQWVAANIAQYGGDPNKIVVGGHSAGGQLASLISIHQQYFDSLGINNPIKGTILIDAAGLDMYGYLKEQQFETGHTYLQTFTANEQIWKEASPLYHLHAEMPPMLILRGEKTYESIKKRTEKFVSTLQNQQASFEYQIINRKKHVAMITQFIWSGNPLYAKMIEFINKATRP